MVPVGLHNRYLEGDMDVFMQSINSSIATDGHVTAGDGHVYGPSMARNSTTSSHLHVSFSNHYRPCSDVRVCPRSYVYKGIQLTTGVTQGHVHS